MSTIAAPRPLIEIEPLTRQQRHLLRALMVALILGLATFALAADIAAPRPPQICKAFTFGKSAFGSCDTFGDPPPQPALLF